MSQRITQKYGYWEFYVKGSTDKRKEELLQIDCWSWLKQHHPEIPAFHPVNEGLIPVQYRTKLTQQGLVSGVSDFILMMPTMHYAFACIELKRATKSLSSPVSDDQTAWLHRTQKAGGLSAVAYGVESFKLAVEFYLRSV